MNGDLRVHTTFLRHPKTRRLRRRLGADGVLSLLALWIFAAESRPSGVLTGLDAPDLEEVSEWTGETGAFIEALVDTGFLDVEGDLYIVHDWAQNNPWAAGAEERSAKARKAAEARWERHAEIGRECAEQCNEHAPGMQIASDPQCPSPFLTSPNTSTSKPAVPPCPHDEVIALYHVVLPELRSVVLSRWNGTRQKNLQARWREDPRHQSLDFWRWYFEGVRENQFYLGRNERNWRADLGWLVKRSNFDDMVERIADQRRRCA